MRRNYRMMGLGGLLFAISLVIGCGGANAGDQRLTNADVSIISFGSLNGEIAPCGWHSGRKGGLARRAGYLDSLATKNFHVVHLDLGNFTNTTDGVDDVTTRFLWDSMVELHVDATTPGPRELEYWKLYRELMGRKDLDVVSSNLTMVENGQEVPVGVPYKIVQRNGLDIGLIGLIGGAQFSSTKLPEGADVRWSDPIEAAKRIVPEIRDQVDLVVLMSQMSNSDTDKLVQEVPGIDVALYGNNAPWREEAEKVGNTVTNATGTRGQYLGHLMLIIGPDGKLVDFGSFNEQVIAPLPERPEMAEKVAALETKQQEIRDAAREGARSSELEISGE